MKKAFSLSAFSMLVLVGLSLAILPIDSAYANPKYASLVLDGETGMVLHQRHANKYRYPASLTKLMTVYLTLDALKNKKLYLSQRIPVSAHAARQPRSKLGLKKGSRISVRDALLAVIIKSANDASVVLAEAIAGSEWQFAQNMTSMARSLGMRHTTFRNASGLHHRKQRTTAYDMARLAMALKRDYKKYYHLFSRTSFTYKGYRYHGHNKVLKRYRGADGLKTGYINASGYNLITSAKRGNHRIIGIVMGGKTSRSRDDHMMKLLNRGFSKVNKIRRERGKYAYISTPQSKPQESLVLARNGWSKLPSPQLKSWHFTIPSLKLAAQEKPAPIKKPRRR